MKTAMKNRLSAYGLLTGITLITLIFAGCGLDTHIPAPPDKTVVPPRELPPAATPEKPDARTRTSLILAEKGAMLLAKNDMEGALRLLEQAVGMNPSCGRAYYHLAEAWIKKQNMALAQHFNRLAQIHLRDDPAWNARAKAQAAGMKQN